MELASSHSDSVSDVGGSNLVANMVFSQVIGTLSQAVINALPVTPDKFLNETVHSENINVCHSVDADSISVSGSLDDLVTYRHKLLTLLFPDKSVKREDGGLSADGHAVDEAVHTEDHELSTDGHKMDRVVCKEDDELSTDGHEMDGTVRKAGDRLSTDGIAVVGGTGPCDRAVQCDLGLSSKSAVLKVSRKRSEEESDDVKEEVEEEAPLLLSKKGRTIRRPSKFKNLLVLKMNSDDSAADVAESGGTFVRASRKHKTVVQSNFLNKHRKKSKQNSQKISVEEVRRRVEEEKAKEMKENLLDPSEECEKDKTEEEEDDQEKHFEFMRSGLHIMENTKFLEQKRIIKKDYEDKMPFKYFCDLCSFKSKRASHFENHQKHHMKNPDLPLYRCDQCDFKAVRQSVLQRHKKTHETSLLMCSSCDRYVASNEKQLAKHMKTHKKKLNRCLPMLYCHQCSFQTLSKTELMTHLDMHGPGTVRAGRALFQCNQCSYKTLRKEHLVRHRNNVHSNRRPYLCDLCGASFKRVDALASHKTTHLERHQRKLPFSCSQCKKAFKSQAHLKEHLSVHSTTRSYQCHICGQMFKTRAVQLKHQQSIHFNPRSHKCSACNKDFNTKYALQRHVRTHEDDLVARPAVEDTLAPLGQQFDEAAGVKDKGSPNEEMVDENISAIQTITIGSDSQLQSTDIGEVYIQGLDSGTISIVNFDGRQIFIPSTDGEEHDVSAGEPVKQYIITQQSDASWALTTADTETGTSSSSDTVRHVLLSTSADSVGNLASADSVGDLVPSLGEVHVQMPGESNETVKHIMIPISSITAGTSSAIIEQSEEDNMNLMKKDEGEIMEQTISGQDLDTGEVSEYDLKVENGQTLLTLSTGYSQNT